MILQKMVNIQAFQKVRQLEVFLKSLSYQKNYGFKQFNRSLCHITGRQCNHLPNVKGNASLLSKFPITRQVYPIQCRNASVQGSHVNLWRIERLVAAGLAVMLPVAFLFENAIMEGAVAVGIVMHQHWGLEAMVIDYARPVVVGTFLPKFAHFALNIISAVTLAGLLVLVYNGPGIVKATKQFWALGKKSKDTST